MSGRFLLALGGFILVVGSGSFWLLYNIQKKKRFLQNLLSLPKERRFFWYLLRKDGYDVQETDLHRSFRFFREEVELSYSLSADFIAVRNHKRYAGIAIPEPEEKEFIKLFFVYSTIFRANGVIFYDPVLRLLTVWERG